MTLNTPEHLQALCLKCLACCKILAIPSDRFLISEDDIELYEVRGCKLIMLDGKFYIVNGQGRSFAVNLFVDSEPLPVLWNRQGDFCIVPKAVIQNALNSLAIYENLSSKTTKPQVLIYWEQGTPIDNKAGRALLGE